MPTQRNGVHQILHEILERADVPDSVRAESARLLKLGTVDLSTSFPPEIQARLQAMQEPSLARERAIDRSVKQRATQLLHTALRAGTATQRIYWLQRTADVLGQGYAPAAACKPGCSHCCKIPVKISQAEARQIGKAIGRTPLPPAAHAPAPTPDDWLPCTFLEMDLCSIHTHRPAVCRSHLNLDEDDLLCRPVPGTPIPVPYLDTTHLVIAAVELAGKAPWADIRQWFPGPKL